MGDYDRFKADPMGVRQYIEEGKHRLLIKRTAQGPSKNPQKKNQENSIVEFKVIRSEPLTVGGEAMKVGSACSLVETDAQAGYFGNVLAFTAGVLGYSIDEMKADPDFDSVFASVWGPEAVLVEMLVDCVAQKVPTNAGGVYTAKTWEPVDSGQYEKDGLIAPDGAWSNNLDRAEAAE